VFEIEVDDPPEPFASTPYAFRMQLFSSYGVREFEISAPPPMPRKPTSQREIIFEEAKRISECYVFSSLLNIVKALQVHWLPMPTPGLRAGQHWQALVGGIGPADRVFAWNGDTGELLAEVGPYGEGAAELSLVIPPDAVFQTLQLTLNGQSFRRAAEYLAAARRIDGRKEAGPNPTLLRQTPLYLVGQLALPQAASAVGARSDANVLRVQASSAESCWSIELDAHNPGHQPRITRSSSPMRPASQVPSRFHRVRRSGRKGQHEIEIVSFGDGGAELPLARYRARPWYDRGCLTGRFFVQLSADGLTLNVYRRGITHHADPDVGRGGEGTRTARNTAAKARPREAS
jgi:hypothetical protein